MNLLELISLVVAAAAALLAVCHVHRRERLDAERLDRRLRELAD